MAEIGWRKAETGKRNGGNAILPMRSAIRLPREEAASGAADSGPGAIATGDSPPGLRKRGLPAPEHAVAVLQRL